MNGPGLVSIGLVLATIGVLAAPAQGHFVGCPAGQAIRGINFVTRSLVCIPVGTEDIATLQTQVATLQSQVADLQVENAQQADAIAALQSQLAGFHTLTSPDGQYSIHVTNDGIVLQGPDVRIQLDQGDPASPSPTVTIAGTTVGVFANVLGVDSGTSTNITSGATTNIASGTTTTIASGIDTNVTSGNNTNISSSAGTNMLSGGNTNITGAGIELNGGCAPIARVGDHVDIHDLIDTGSPTVRSC